LEIEFVYRKLWRRFELGFKIKIMVELWVSEGLGLNYYGLELGGGGLIELVWVLYRLLRFNVEVNVVEGVV
jgi:hypothetical protein